MFQGRNFTFRSQYSISKDVEWETKAFLSCRDYEAVSFTSKTNQFLMTKTIFGTHETRFKET